MPVWAAVMGQSGHQSSNAIQALMLGNGISHSCQMYVTVTLNSQPSARPYDCHIETCVKP